MRMMFCAVLAAIIVTNAGAGPRPAPDSWIVAWASAQQTPEPDNRLKSDLIGDVTLRQMVRLTLGGTAIRVRLSNAFGAQPLHILGLHVAEAERPGSSAVVQATDHAATFVGAGAVIIPAGAEYLSDPIALPVQAGRSLAISLHLDGVPPSQTGHPGSRATTYLAAGDQTAAVELPAATKVEHWYFLTGVEVRRPGPAGSIVAFGDSITDGHGSTTDANDRWPDLLADRLKSDPRTRDVAVVNAGIGGNRLLLDGLGPNALARFDRDVLARPGVRWVIVLEGVNDLGMLSHDRTATPEERRAEVAAVEAAYAQMIARAHAAGLRIIGATILPYEASTFYRPPPASEADRQAVNAWIRAPGRFDAVIDFDVAMRDPTHPARLLAAYDSGDHLHPSPAGYAAMAKAVPLSLFEDQSRARTSGEPRPRPAASMP
jgi:lysophospholipase L1-like esterase